jgi:hypothetical protein
MLSMWTKNLRESALNTKMAQAIDAQQLGANVRGQPDCKRASAPGFSDEKTAFNGGKT